MRSVKIKGANCLSPLAHISLNFDGWASLYPTINNIAAKLAMGSLFNKLGNKTKLASTKKPCKIADNLDGVVTQTLKIANDYNSYLNAAKINSKLLFEIFENDPLKKNIN